jgi:DNA-binding response OmpR family regulator
MAIAHIDSYRTNTATATPTTAQAPKLQAVPTETEARGFALYVGIDEATAAAAGVSLTDLVAALRKTVTELVPAAANETYAAVALAPKGLGGSNIDATRLALRDPRAIDKLTVAKHQSGDSNSPALGVTVDFSRHKIFVDGHNAQLTEKEFALVRYLVENTGETISRQEIVDVVWAGEAEGAIPNERTIDVHVRRLRAKLGIYEDIIRTVRGGGYRFDQHPDVLIEA